MASPLRFNIVPDCKLHIEVPDKEKNNHLTDPGKPMSFELSDMNKDLIGLKKNVDKTLKFGGKMSPSSKLTLPNKTRETVGVPEKAKRFAFMHPPDGIGQLIDWGKYYNEYHNNEGAERVKDKSADDKPETPTDMEKKIGRGHAMLFGAFVYFGENMEVLSVNALTFQQTDYSISLCGPWETGQSTVTSMIELKRLNTIYLQSFREAGIVSAGWVAPEERFASEAVSKCSHNRSGGLVFLREDGTGISYHVSDSSGTHFPEEDVEIVVDCFLSVGNALLTDEGGDIKFTQDFGENSTEAERDHIGMFPRQEEWKKMAEDLFDEHRASETDWLQRLRKELNTRKLDESLIVHKACQANLNIEIIMKIMNDIGVPAIQLGRQDKFQWSPLHYACRFASENFDLIQYLVNNHRGMVKEGDIFGRYPLHLACDGEAPEKVIMLLLKAYPEAVIKKTPTMQIIPLHIACHRTLKFEVIKALIDSDVKKESVAHRSIIGRLPLHMAVEEKMDTKVIELLLEKGDEEDIRSPFAGMIPLHLACLNQSTEETVRLLLEKDGKEDTPDRTIDVKVKNNIESNARGSKLAFLSLATDNKENWTALQLALKYSNPDAARLLLMRDKKIERRDETTRSIALEVDKSALCYPLHLACQNNVSVDIIRLLLELDPEKEALHGEDHIGMKPIHYACDKNKADGGIIQTLFEADNNFRADKIRNPDASPAGMRNSATSRRESFTINPLRLSLNTTFSKDSIAKGKKKIKSLARSLDVRQRSPLICALRAGAPTSVVEFLTSPDKLYLKGFDDNYVAVLGSIVSKNSAMQRHVLELLSERAYFGVLFIELYAHVGAISSFMEASDHLLVEEKKLTYFLPSVFGCCLVIFILREIAQFQSQGWHYFKDVWNLPEYLSIVFSIRSLLHMAACINSADQNTFKINRTELILTANFLIITFIFYLRSTFLPFARFVGGLLLILTTLVPFFIVGSLVLLAFTIAYRISDADCQTEGAVECSCQSSLRECYLATVQMFFNGSDETKRALDIIFGVVAIVILLNVVIAIVGDAWERATAKASSLYFTFRVGYLLEARMFGLLQKKVKRNGYLFRLTDLIDKMADIRLIDKVIWEEGNYASVQTRNQYTHPELYFIPDIAKEIKKAHSLEAHLYWAQHEDDSENDSENDNEKEKFVALAKVGRVLFVLGRFISHVILYIFLLALGLPFCGWFWPVSFRRGVLSLGVGNMKTQSDNQKAEDSKTEGGNTSNEACEENSSEKGSVESKELEVDK